ncbi:Mini-ribonuclease 3 [Caldicellulosiruptoraceae bacterium PP1]
MVKYNPLSYAYIGDAVYELFIRDMLIEKYPNFNPHKYHIMSIKYVKASNQAYAIRALWDELDDEEKLIAKKGRNAKPHTIPKNADIVDYKFATAFECLIGYLYLEKREERLQIILQKTFNILTKGRCD